MHNFILQKLYKFPSMSIKFRVTDYLNWKNMMDDANQEINSELINKMLWVSNQETLANVDMLNVS